MRPDGRVSRAFFGQADDEGSGPQSRTDAVAANKLADTDAMEIFLTGNRRAHDRLRAV